MNPDKTHEFRLGSISAPDELAELWAIDKTAYGEASITYEKFRDWWLAYPPGLMVLNWNQGIGGAIGLWPLSDRSAARLTNAQMKEADVTGRMMRRSAKHRLANGTSQAWCFAQNLSARVLFAFFLATDSAIGSTQARSHTRANFLPSLARS